MCNQDEKINAADHALSATLARECSQALRGAFACLAIEININFIYNYFYIPMSEKHKFHNPRDYISLNWCVHVARAVMYPLLAQV